MAMKLRDLKITLLKVKGNCSRCREGMEFEVRNAKLYLPEEGLCLFALGALIPNLTASLITTGSEDDFLNLINEFQCPDPFAEVRFKVEPLEQKAS
jgi:uncharacterized repeat protein (TIGR04076 family)